MKRLIILGANHFGRTIGKIAEQLNCYDEIGFLDDDSKDGDVLDLCANYVLYMDDDTEFYPAFENNYRRSIWLNSFMSLGCNIATFVHPSAKVDPSVKIISGCAILADAIISQNCLIKVGTVVSERAVIGENCILEEGTTVCAGVPVDQNTVTEKFSTVNMKN